MKNLKILIVLVLLFAFNFIGCSKSSKDISESSPGNNENKGLLITVTGIDSNFNGEEIWLSLSEEDDTVAFSSGVIKDGKAEMHLRNYEDDKPWTKTGEYYISITPSIIYGGNYEYKLKNTGNTFDVIVANATPSSTKQKSTIGGIKITVININFKNGDPVHISIYDKDKYKIYLEDGWPRNYLAVASGSGDVMNHSADVFLGGINPNDPRGEKTPFMRPGEYYLEIGGAGGQPYELYYTNGKTLEALGINYKPSGMFTGKFPDNDEYLKLPLYNLQTSENTIDFTKQVVSVDIMGGGY